MPTTNLIVVNANIRTVDDRDSRAQAALIRDGLFAAVGTEEQVRADSATADVVDLCGRTVIPGMIDVHNHLSVAAFAPDSVDFSATPVSTLAEALSVIEKHCTNVPAGRWVRGTGLIPSALREQRGPTRTELDEVTPNNPFFLIDSTYHAGWANSSALAEVGIDEHTPQPWGGQIEKGRDGLPTGTLFETATTLLHSASWNSYAERDWDRAITLLQAKMKDYLAVGLTGVGDAMVTAKAAELYRRADAAGGLPLTVQQLHHSDGYFAMQDLRRYDIVEQIKEASTKMLRSGALKMFLDAAFPDGPAIDHIHGGCKTHRGATYYTKAEINERAMRASDLSINTAIHAMGNCAIDAALDAYQAVRRSDASDSVLRIEHAFVAEPRQGARMAELGVDLVTNPGFGYLYSELFAMWRGDDQPHLRILPVRSMIDNGARVSLASDHPSDEYSPFEIMWRAVTRATVQGGQVDDPEEAITAAEALRLYTINAAHASDRGDEEGSIEVGKRANFVVLDRDIVACPTDDIRATQVDMTFVDGKQVYKRDN